MVCFYCCIVFLKLYCKQEAGTHFSFLQQLIGKPILSKGKKDTGSCTSQTQTIMTPGDTRNNGTFLAMSDLIPETSWRQLLWYTISSPRVQCEADFPAHAGLVGDGVGLEGWMIHRQMCQQLSLPQTSAVDYSIRPCSARSETSWKRPAPVFLSALPSGEVRFSQRSKLNWRSSPSRFCRFI